MCYAILDVEPVSTSPAPSCPCLSENKDPICVVARERMQEIEDVGETMILILTHIRVDERWFKHTQSRTVAVTPAEAANLSAKTLDAFAWIFSILHFVLIKPYLQAIPISLTPWEYFQHVMDVLRILALFCCLWTLTLGSERPLPPVQRLEVSTKQ